MALGVSNRDGGKTSERGLYDGLGALLSGEVISGFTVHQDSPIGMSVKVGGLYDSSTGLNRDSAIIRDGLRTYDVFTDDGVAVSVSVDTPHASLKRIDTVVMYIDKSVSRTLTVLDNTNGVVKLKAVAGVPDSNAVPPSDSAIASSISAGNPYIKLADMVVNPSPNNTVKDADITNRRTIAKMPVSSLNGGTTAGALVSDASGNVSVDAKYGQQKLLASSPGVFLQDGQSLTLSEPISAQENGIILVWSAYTSSTVRDYDFSYVYIPKSAVAQREGSLFSVPVSRASAQVSYVKGVYISDTGIGGYTANNQGNGTQFVLREVWGY